MKTLYIERSTGTGRGGEWVQDLDLTKVDRIVVGTGPGSFAGIRSALALAQGYALATKCELLGLPSACSLAADVIAEGRGEKIAVVGDSRRGMAWVALFEGYRLVKDVFQVAQTELGATVPADDLVVTPDDARIGELLKTAFGARYCGGKRPTTDGLRRFAEENPSVLKSEPLPIYLNPAVRAD